MLPLFPVAADPMPSFFEVLLNSSCELLSVCLLLGSWLSELDIFDPLCWPPGAIYYTLFWRELPSPAAEL